MKRYGYFLDLLKLDIEKYPVIAVVGGGGKTSLIYRLNEELQALGKKLIIKTRYIKISKEADRAMRQNEYSKSNE